MSLETVEGIYRDGAVQLSERPKGITESRVLVTFLPERPDHSAQGAGSRLMHFGMFPGDGVTNDQDFARAEWQGENLTDG